MDKQTEKAINVIIISLVVTLFLILGGVYVDKNKDHYFIDGPGGEFEFNVDRSHNDIYHVLRIADSTGHIHNTPFDYAPNDLKFISYDSEINNVLDKDLIYITQDPEDSTITNGKTVVASLTLYRMINKLIPPYVDSIANVAVTQTYGGYNENIAIVNCDDVSETQGVILLKQGFSNSIYLNNNCVVLEFIDADDSVKVATAFIYRSLGIL